MTYPPTRYDGDGEVSATVHRADDAPDLVMPNGSPVHYLATGASTAGLFGLYRWVVPPGPGGASPHIHRTFSESFYILEGTVEIYDGARWIRGGRDDFFHVPPGGIHGFRNGGDVTARMLIHFAPGAPREEYFENLHRLADMTDEERLRFFLAHDNEYVEGG